MSEPANALNLLHSVLADALASVESWERKVSPDLATNDARFFSGHGPGCMFLVGDFEIASQGFPAGTRGYDGTACIGGSVVRLPRLRAKEVFEQASAYVEKIEAAAKPGGT
jgi:hypothetical protein